MPTEELPWDNEAAFTRLLMYDQTDKASFHRPDIWHNTQLGIGKAFAANSLVCFLEWFHGNGVETGCTGHGLSSVLQRPSSLIIMRVGNNMVPFRRLIITLTN